MTGPGDALRNLAFGFPTDRMICAGDAEPAIRFDLGVDNVTDSQDFNFAAHASSSHNVACADDLKFPSFASKRALVAAAADADQRIAHLNLADRIFLCIRAGNYHHYDARSHCFLHSQFHTDSHKVIKIVILGKR